MSDMPQNRLNEVWNRVAPRAQNSEHHYKMLILDLMAFERTLLDGTVTRADAGKSPHSDSINTLRVIPLPPVNRKSSSRNEDINRYLTKK